MAKIFAAQAELNNHPSRNNFDLSHKIHMSGKMGLLYPVFCKPVVPGDSFRIDSGCAFNFMPMPYPTQTRMRFIQHFFYVRNKNLWKNWENWLQGLPDNDTGQPCVPPYIDQPVSFYRTGTLADFLGIPTTVLSTNPKVALPSVNVAGVTSAGRAGNIIWMASVDNSSQSGDSALRPFDYYSGEVAYDYSGMSTRLGDLYIMSLPPCGTTYGTETSGNGWSVNGSTRNMTRFVEVPTFKNLRLTTDGSITFTLDNPVIPTSNTPIVIALWELKKTSNDIQDARLRYVMKDKRWGSDNAQIFSFKLNNEEITALIDIYEQNPTSRYFLSVTAYRNQNVWSFTSCSPTRNAGSFPVYLDDPLELEEVNGSNPFYSSTNTDDDTVRLSALPFRAYESIYNAFYRNTTGNQPFMINGRPQYNRYNTTIDDGADLTKYKLFHRNWELDAYTSCLPSPQQGAAPVVGISALGEVTIVDPETGVTTTARASDTANGIQISDVNLGDQSHQAYLINLATSGITINDFRQVNSLQRFLETNIRKGYRYVDFIEGHFGHRIKGAILDMPEFIGGFSQTVDVNMISNTAAILDGDRNTLGDYGGQASAFGGTKHTINQYCDDYGFIVGILCLVPEPTYSQLLPKHFNIKQPLDYYFPEFAQIGMQPITYEEVCPVQSHLEHISDPNKKITDVFGYQRPNHDLVWYPDTLHGEFRKSFNKYIVNRLYAERPELGNEFLTIKPEETNTIFNYTAPDEDVFLGQVAFNVQAKRPVPRIVIPTIGR